MVEFRPVGRVQVSLWGRKVGVLVPSPEHGYFAFKFDRSFLETGIEIAPLMMWPSPTASPSARDPGF